MAMTSSIVTPMIVTKVDKLPATAVASETILTAFNYAPDYYVMPYCRSGPYVVGMIVGFLLAKHGTKMRIHWAVQFVGWILTTGTCIAVVFGLHNLIAGTGHPSEAANISYNGLSRTAWAVGLSWITLACVTGHGGFVNTILSWRGLLPLSRLTYCIYLIHMYLMAIYFANQRETTHITTLNTVMLFLGEILLSCFVAFFMSLAFESPFVALDSIMMTALSNKGRSEKSEETVPELQSVEVPDVPKVTEPELETVESQEAAR
jgi:peptidoglycan/LPS O-acetylase OafA/YrhL